MDNKSLIKLRLNTKLTYVLMNFSGYNICVRHWLLRETIGTRPEEESSYNTVMKLLFGVPITVVGFSLLELGFYFLYNYKVDNIQVYKILQHQKFFHCAVFFQFHPWKDIIAESVPSIPSPGSFSAGSQL